MPPSTAPPRHTSIRHRLMRVVLTTTLVALLLSATVLLLYELRMHRQTWVQDLQTQADLVARASLPAMGLDDPRVARENLALLHLRPQIEAAGLYDARGLLFAAYAAPGQTPPPPHLGSQLPALPLQTFDGERLELRQPVSAGGGVGTMVLRAHYDVMPRLLDYLAILGAVTAASLLLAALVAQRLQSTITDPIVAVADVAREVIAHRNYKLRAPRSTEDEVGALVDAFNDMLGELGEQAEALRAADRRKDEFLATLAHELRNPLAPVATAVAILARPETDRSTQQRMVQMIQRQMHQFVRLIDDLMELSRMSTGRLVLRPERLDLVEVVRGTLESVGPELLERRHTLVVDWPGPVWLDGDRTRLAQVFINLLGNAAKYTEPGGRIEIRFVVGPAQVEVRVIDNGIGIPPEAHEHVFEMFTQLDRSLTTRGRAGLGVGLAVSRQLVSLHHGRLTLDSAGRGHGSTFIVQLPRVPTAVPPPAPPPPEGLPAVAPARALRILVADDNADFADSLSTMLQAAGHQVTVAHDGQTALGLAQRELPDVGLLDVGMPGLDGYELATALRRLPGGAGCLLVAITGWGQQADQERARAAGYDAHLVKPVEMPALFRLLDRVAALA